MSCMQGCACIFVTEPISHKPFSLGLVEIMSVCLHLNKTVYTQTIGLAGIFFFTQYSEKKKPNYLHKQIVFLQMNRNTSGQEKFSWTLNRISFSVISKMLHWSTKIIQQFFFLNQFVIAVEIKSLASMYAQICLLIVLSNI